MYGGINVYIEMYRKVNTICVLFRQGNVSNKLEIFSTTLRRQQCGTTLFSVDYISSNCGVIANIVLPLKLKKTK